MSKTKYLEKEFPGKGEVKGYYFKLNKQSHLVSLYEVRWDCTIRYEIFIRRVNKRFNTETYPSSKQFGKTAFTTNSIEKAEEYFNILQKREEARLKKRASMKGE